MESYTVKVSGVDVALVATGKPHEAYSHRFSVYANCILVGNVALFERDGHLVWRYSSHPEDPDFRTLKAVVEQLMARFRILTS